MDPTVESARRFVAAAFPTARAALLGGSAGTPYGTGTSDLDIVVVLDPSAVVFRRTQRHEGRVVEAFVHTSASLAQYIDREIRSRRAPLLHICAEGRVLADVDGLGTRIRDSARQQRGMGPPPLSVAEEEDRRYTITDLLDDLAGSPDPDEVAFIAARLLILLAELILLQDRQWISSGKWLVRRLRAWAPGLGRQLVDGYRRTVAAGDPRPLLGAGAALLDARGGRVQDGYMRVGGAV